MNLQRKEIVFYTFLFQYDGEKMMKESRIQQKMEMEYDKDLLLAQMQKMKNP